IEKRSSEVWSLLGAVKSEFGKFAGILERAEKQISTVGKSLGDASRKTRTIERRLRGVESLGQDQAQALLGDLGLDAIEAELDGGDGQESWARRAGRAGKDGGPGDHPGPSALQPWRRWRSAARQRHRVHRHRIRALQVVRQVVA